MVLTRLPARVGTNTNRARTTSRPACCANTQARSRFGLKKLSFAAPKEALDKIIFD